MKKKDSLESHKKVLTKLNILLILIIVCLVLLMIFHPNKKGLISNITHDRSNSYLLTNPILDCEINNSDESSVLFSDDVKSEVNKIKDKYSLDFISLYYRDLNNGPWVGVNEKEVFSPASLLKVPILIEFLHEAESNPSILNKEVDITSSDINQNISQNIKFDGTLIIGQKYSLEQVAESMIEKSDNTAVTAMLSNININGISDVFRAIGVPFKDVTSEVDVRVKDYAGFFRVLYNASYLNREMSEKALQILTKSEYKDGLVAGVPTNITVAHKFGERTLAGVTDSSQLHDCGIIYYPGNPYILCIMTRGNDLKVQGQSIEELSNYIYNQIDNNSKKNQK